MKLARISCVADLGLRRFGINFSAGLLDAAFGWVFSQLGLEMGLQNIRRGPDDDGRS